MVRFFWAVDVAGTDVLRVLVMRDFDGVAV